MSVQVPTRGRRRNHLRLLFGAGIISGALLAACGGSGGGSASSSSTSSGGSSGNGTHQTASSGDQQVCAQVNQAVSAYRSKSYAQWRKDMADISRMSHTATNPQLKTYAHAADLVNVRPQKGGYNFGGVGAYEGLQKTCHSLGQ